MTRSGFPHLSLMRTVLAVVVVVDLVSFFFFLADARAVALANGIALNTFNDLISRTAMRGALVLIGVAGAVAFGRRPGRLRAGVLAWGTLMLLSTAHAQLFGSPWRHLFYSGLCLSGWLLGLAVSRRRGAPTDESDARIGSIALLGAAYLNAGISKLVYGGVDWMSGLPIQSVIIGQDGLVVDSIVSVYRSWVVATPTVASFFSVATLGFELAGPLMLVGRRTRLCVVLGLFVMHTNIYVLTRILYWESMVFLVLFGLSSDGQSSENVSSSVAAIGFHDRRFIGAAALLTVGALLAIGHQSWRYVHAHSPALPTVCEPLNPTRARNPSAPSAPMLRQVGPFAVGQTLAEGWSVDSLDVRDDGFVAVLSGRRGRAVFEITCTASEHPSPLDLGAAHIACSSDMDSRDLDALAWAFQAQVRKAAEGRDICDRLSSWLMSAQAGQPR